MLSSYHARQQQALTKVSTSYLRWLNELNVLSTQYQNGMISQRYALMLGVRERIIELMTSGLSHGAAVRVIMKEYGIARSTVYTYL